MDTLITEIADAVTAAMRSSGYAESTIALYSGDFRRLADFCGGKPYDADVGRSYVDAPKPDGNPYCPSSISHRRKVVHICDAYVAGGEIDLGIISYAPPQPVPASAALRAALAAYEGHNGERELADGTRGWYGRLAREYLLHLEYLGIEDVTEADAASVLGFMPHMKARWARSSTYQIASGLRPFLKWLGRDDLVYALKMSGPTRERAIIPMLADGEEEALASACCDGAVTLADAAITLLVLTTGIRACDVINLKIADIDWRGPSIGILQHKTGNPLTVPLLPAPAEAIGRYLLRGRPASDSPNVFVRQRAPHTPFADPSTVYCAIRRAFAAAGVEGGGSRLLRHNAASRMLMSGARLPVISAVLGHADPNSTNVYMEADERSMAACVLPLPRGCLR